MKPRAFVVICNGAEPPAGMVIVDGAVAMDMSPVFRPMVSGDDSGGSSEMVPTAIEPGGPAITGGDITTIEETAITSD